MLWERALARHPELEAALSDNSEVESCDESVAGDPLAGDGPAEDQDIDDLFKDINDNPFANIDLDFKDAPNDAPASVPVVDRAFKDSADLWLTPARTGLEHALSALGIGFSEIFPTNRPLLVFGSRRSDLTVPEYHRVEVKREGWPSRLHSTERLTVNAAAEILASSVDEAPLSEAPSYFEGETVAAEVPNPLLAADRWIVMWPILNSLPERVREDSTTELAELHQWERVRRVVWCVDREQIGRRDTLNWLSHFWQDTPIRIALFRAASFVDHKEDEAAQSKMLPRVRRTLDEKFNGIKGHPWVVVGP